MENHEKIRPREEVENEYNQISDELEKIHRNSSSLKNTLRHTEDESEKENLKNKINLIDQDRLNGPLALRLQELRDELNNLRDNKN